MSSTTNQPELLPYRKIREDLFRPLSGMTRKYFAASS